jgi:uncharacterized protein YndB with AHSA1/START domain
MELKFEIHARIQRPISEVRDAVYNPGKLSTYLTTGGASGPLVEGTTVMWSFADAPEKYGGGNVSVPVRVTKVQPKRLIQFEWSATDRDYNTRVQMKFEPLGPSETMVTISESGWRETAPGLASSYDNCGGWMQMACFLKGYVEYGINLRKGIT